ncbi:RNA-binding protein BRN2 (Protein BRUNO-LIKE 2) (AtBRN2), partial [Durusdinium trenchii]
MSSDDGYKLFVGSLPADCTSEELHAVFSTYGVVTHVHVMNPHPRSGQRCAFVFYTTKAAGDDACKVLDNQYRIRTDAAQPIVVRWSKDSGFDAAANGDCEDGPRRSDPPEDGHKLFVGNLPADLSEEELRLVFGTYGEVVHCHIMSIHPKSGLRCAFVYYRDLQSAEAAIQLLDNEYRIREKAMEPIQVRWANKDSVKGKGESWDRLDWPNGERERKGKGDKGDLQNAWRGDLQNARGDWITMSDRKGKGDGWDRREWSNGKGLPAKGKDMYSDWFPGTKGGSKGWHPPWEDRSWEKGFGKD